jgi:ABC-type multidrug transport system fused ATPase/permease subunit
VASALTSLALFEILRFPLFMLPNVINQLVEAGVSVSRIASFLNSPDHKPVVAGDLEGVGAEVSGASFVYENVRPVKKTRSPIGVSAKLQKELADSEWELQLLKSQLASAEQKLSTLEGTQSYGATEEKSLLALSRINLGISEGEFIVIVGAVGSGKSSLLKALLGEVRQLSGTVKLNGKISYFVQSPFIMNDTVEGNILFGKEGKNKSLYEAAISTCALAHDLTLLPQGDLTEIGEKGITLSGGQKARIAMARALYHDADLYFLDDPLAAVDANVGRHLFQECIVNEMLLGKTSQDSRKKTVVLVTNALQYLSHPLVDKIIVLSNGQIVESGSYGQLTNNEHSTFKKYMESFNEKKTGPSIEQDTEKIIDLQPQSDLESKEFATTLPSEGTKSSGDDGDAQLHQVSLMTDEMQERETGEVSLKVYLTWANAAGGLWVVAAIMFAYILGECTRILSNWWLTYWSRHSEDNQLHFLFIYGIINVCAIFVDFTRVMILLHCSLRASRTVRMSDTCP